MSGFRFSVAARADLLELAEHTIEVWGSEQADRYLERLRACCQLIVDHPVIARPCDDVRPGYFRLTEGRHVLFFKRDGRGVLIVRILHDRMDPSRHLSEADEGELDER